MPEDNDGPGQGARARLTRVGLTPREQSVLLAVSMRLTNAEIAQMLHVSVRTVESHVASLLRKFGVAGRRELATAAAEVVFTDTVRTGVRHPGDPRATVAPVSVAELDSDGVIVGVNAEWERFCLANGGSPQKCGTGVSFLAVCEAAGDILSRQVEQHIRDAINGLAFVPRHVRLPCPSPRQERWFDELIASRIDARGRCIGATVSLAPVGTEVIEAAPPGIETEHGRGRRMLDAIMALAALTPGRGGVDAVLERAVNAAAVSTDAGRAAIGVLRDGEGTSLTLSRRAPEGGLVDSNAYAVIKVGERDFGTIWVSDALTGEFSDEDERMLNMIAGLAGVAIANTMLYAEGEALRGHLASETRLAADLLNGDAVDAVDVVLDRALADLQLVSVDAEFRTEEGDGPQHAHRGTADADAAEPAGPRLVVPIVVEDEQLGSLTAARAAGRPVFDANELALLRTYARFVGLGARLEAGRRAAQDLALAVERERIAADLHASLLRSLHEVVVSLAAVVSHLTDPVATGRLAAVIDKLDGAIADARSLIFTPSGEGE